MANMKHRTVDANMLLGQNTELAQLPGQSEVCKAILVTILLSMVVLLLLFSAMLPSPAFALIAETIPAQTTGDTSTAEQAQLIFCMDSAALSSHFVRLAGQREPVIHLAFPDTLPEAGKGAKAFLKEQMVEDNGAVRWGFQSAIVSTRKGEGFVVFSYTMTYHTTKEEDAAARTIAAETVEGWTLADTNGSREKIDMLQRYISAHWRYDESLENQNAYTVLTEQSGTCLGFAMASQMLLDELGIASQTVHGRLASTDELHIILLVQIDDLWYTFDPTGLAMARPNRSHYLKSEYHTDFTPLDEYCTDAFRGARPMHADELALAG